MQKIPLRDHRGRQRDRSQESIKYRPSYSLANAARSFRESRGSCSTSHSHMVRTFQPCFLSAVTFLLSRSTFPFSLRSQNSSRVLGRTEFLHTLCLCQKQPCTNIAILRPLRTMSGRPGIFWLWSENRKPSLWSKDRTLLSGRVSRPLIRLMFQLLRSAVSLSIRNFRYTQMPDWNLFGFPTRSHQRFSLP